MGDQFSEKKLGGLKVKLASREEIEAHEIFFDSKKAKKDSPIFEAEGGKLELPINKISFLSLFFLTLISFSILAARTAYFQVLLGEEFKERASKNITRTYPIPAKRGIIYDRNFVQLVANVPSFDVVVDPREIPHDKDGIENFTQRLSQALKKPMAEVRDLIEKNVFEARSFLLADNISHDAILFFETNKLPGVFLEKNSAREYNFAEYLSHVLGYTGKINKNDLENNTDYFIADLIGRDGLEAYYEKILRGRFGKKVVKRDSQGYSTEERIESLPEDGKNLQLSLDVRLQEKLHNALNAKLKELGLKRAAGLAVDPRNGEILAMVSLPTFDNNLFSKGISRKDLESILGNPAKPLFNRAVSGVYPSGSTIKPLIASAALQENVISPRKLIFAPESIQVGSWVFEDWKFHGLIDLKQAIAQSSNVYFYTVGGGYGDIEGLGIERIKKYLSLFGWGRILGIDLTAEAAGFLPDPEWKKENIGENWYIGDTYNTSIGQGYVGVTPLQLAFATAALSNGGTVFRPMFVSLVVDSERRVVEEFQPEVLNQNFIDQKNLEEVKKGMREGVVSGSSKLLGDLLIKAAGKTGTAQFGDGEKTHAWWTGFAPYDDPQIVLTILIEEGGQGSQVAVPVAKEVLGWYFREANSY